MKIVSICGSYGYYDFVTTYSEQHVVGMVGATQKDLDAWNESNYQIHPFLILNCLDSMLEKATQPQGL